MGEPSERPVVAELDLRGAEPAQALKLLDEPWRTDTRRVLVIDETALLPSHAAVFAGLQSRLVGRLLCVAVGRAADGTGGVPGATVLEPPGTLVAGQGAGLLWVPDPDGHHWRPGDPTLARRRGEPGEGLARLRDLLRIPEVFDRTAELAATVPGGVSNPGLRLAATLPDDAEFPGALLEAIVHLLEPGVPPPPPPPSAVPGDPGGGRTGRETVRLREDGPLRQAEQQAERAVAAACRAAEDLDRPLSLFLLRRRRRAAQAAEAAGLALGTVRSTWAMLVDRVPVGSRPLTRQGELLRKQGIELPPAGAGTPGRGRGRPDLGEYVAEALARGTSLRGVIEGFRERKRLIPPRAAPKTELDRACPPDLPERLRTRTASPPEPWLPFPGLAAALVGGLGAFGVVGGTVIALVYTVLVALMVLGGPEDRHPQAKPFIAATGGAGAAGVAAAGWTGPAVLGPGAFGAMPPGPVDVITSVLALAGAVAAVLWPWRCRCRRWADALGVREAPRALADMQATAARLAAGWASATHHTGEAAELTRAMAAVEGVREALRDHADALREQGVCAGGRAELVEIVRGRLNDLVAAVLAPRWRCLPAEMPGTHQDHAKDETADLIEDWERHVHLYGPLEPPPFTADPEPDEPAAPGPSPPPAEDAFAIGDDVACDADAEMWQLLGPGDLPLVSIGDRCPPTLRFAPRGARNLLRGHCPADTLWARSSRHAGVLRLVPVRPDLVQRHWHGTPTTPDDLEEAR